MSTPALISDHGETARYRVTGMDCPSCATKIEKAARSVAGVEEVKVSTATQIMSLRLSAPETQLLEVERAVAIRAGRVRGYFTVSKTAVWSSENS